MNLSHYVDVLYNKYYPLTIVNRFISKRRNHNKSFTLLCGNCMGGYIYHQLGVGFLSPTINLMMSQIDLFKFCSSIDYYKNCKFIEIPSSSCLVGKLGDITIYFTHYPTFSEGVEKWKKRIARIDYDNLFIIASDRDGMTSEMIRQYGNVKCRKLVIFTSKKYDFPYCLQLDRYKEENEIGNILQKTLYGKWLFEEFFDYVGWLNSNDSVAEHFKR